MIGRTVGHYRILDKLGAGGMGEVYRARDDRLGRDVAIKVLPKRTAADPEARARLLREARTASKLNHPHICTIHEVGEADGLVYISMEYVEGQPLSALLNHGALPVEQALRYGIQLAEALEHAHEHHVVHRDLKSANVIITPEQRAKVLDFGLATRIAGEDAAVAATRTEDTLTEPGALAGTLAYMAPEQLRGEPADARSDIWALGVVLYEMAAGRRPFQGHTGFELTAAILNQTPPPLPESLPDGLCGAITRLLAKAPALRYQHAGEVRAALEVIQTDSSGKHAVVHPRPTTQRVRRPSRRRVRALAVLPLVNMSRDPEQEYFADGMTEALIADLAKIRALKIISRTSIMRYKGTGKSLPEIATELGVDAVIEGSVLRAGERVRITAQLIHAASDTHLWAESYDRDLKDVLQLQSEVARTIAEEVRAALTPEESSRLAHAKAVNPEAYEAYLKGLYHWYRLSREHLDKAFEYFQLALQKDPGYAPAYAGIAWVWLSWADCGFSPPQEARLRSREAAEKALELDETLAEGHLSLAHVHFCFEWDWPGAEREFQRAMQLNPGSARAHFCYSDFLISLKRTAEWRPEIERALELDPLNSFYQCFHGWHLVYLGEYDEAVAQLDRAILAEADFSSAHLGLWGAYSRKHLDAEALAAAKKFFAVLRDDEAVRSLERGYSEGGYKAAMKAAADTLAARSTHEHVPAFRIARLYAQAEDSGRALDWLEKAYDQRESPLIHLSAGWDWDCLRMEPRFQALLGRMGLPA